MNDLSVKEKILATNELILSRDYLRKILKVSGKKYDSYTLVDYGYVGIIKKGSSYYNLLLKKFKNPYIIGKAYMGENKYIFGGFDRYNKEGFITQTSNTFTIYNLIHSKKITILGIQFIFKKVKIDFLYGEKIENTICYMDKEKLFLEYLRDYIEYDDTIFIPIIRDLNIEKLTKYLGKYPIKKVQTRIRTLLCI